LINHKTQTKNKLTLFEHQQVAYEEIKAHDIEKTLEGIEALNSKTGINIINLKRNFLSGTQYVGIIQVNDLLIEILPKIDYSDDPTSEFDINSAASNLLVMLAYAYNIKFDSKTISTLAQQTGSWYELLIRFFALEVQRQIKIGLSRHYKPEEDILPYLRGKWNISQQIKTQAYLKTKFNLSYDEFSENIKLNQIFKLVVQMLIYQTNDKISKRLLLDVNKWLHNVELIEDIHQLSEDLIFSRINNRFETAYRLAKLFITGQSIQIKEGRTTAFAFVFDMNILFEAFITQFMIEHHRAIFQPLKREFHIHRQLKNKLTFLAHDYYSKQGIIHLQPDIVIDDKITGTHELIIDTKYKQLDISRSGLNIHSSDIYQMLAYSLRLNTENILLLFPQPNKYTSFQKQLVIPNRGSKTNIYTNTVNLHQPLENPSLLIHDLVKSLKPILGGSNNALQ
jgi:5-methylcytosine-specific restriction enzyme subunit McrC